MCFTARHHIVSTMSIEYIFCEDTCFQICVSTMPWTVVLQEAMASAGALNRGEEMVDAPPPCRVPAAANAVGGRIEVFFAGALTRPHGILSLYHLWQTKLTVQVILTFVRRVTLC